MRIGDNRLSAPKKGTLNSTLPRGNVKLRTGTTFLEMAYGFSTGYIQDRAGNIIQHLVLDQIRVLGV